MKRTLFFVGMMIFFVLASCQGQNVVSEKEVFMENQTQNSASDSKLDSVMGKIANKFTTHESYAQCMARSADMCMDEVVMQSNFNGTGSNLSLSCEDYVLDESQKSCKEQKILSQARESGDVSSCDSLSDEVKESCKYEVIVSKISLQSDISMCKNLSEEYIMPCKKSVIMLQATEKEDVSLCSSLVDDSNLTATGAELEFIQQEQEMQSNMCKEEVEMQIEMKQEEKRIQAELEDQAQEEEMVSQENMNQ